MPIAPENRWLYPLDWRELSAIIRFDRAKGRGERCGRPHGQRVTHLGDGRWWDEERGCWRNGQGRRVRGLPSLEVIEASQPWLASLGSNPQLPITHVVLANAHLDHDLGKDRPGDLAALCQRCHMLHDAAGHRRTRWRNAFRRRAVDDLLRRHG